MPSTDRKLELTAKASMAQPVSQTSVCCNGLMILERDWTDCVKDEEHIHEEKPLSALSV